LDAIVKVIEYKCLINFSTNLFSILKKAGYSGPFCQNVISPCSVTTCLNGATCVVQNVTSAVCLCFPGFTGQFCVSKIDYCSSSPCVNGGVCRSTSSGFSCSCPQSHTGNFCQIRKYACDSL